jgi:hypothetical protein
MPADCALMPLTGIELYTGNGCFGPLILHLVFTSQSARPQHPAFSELIGACLAASCLRELAA